MVLLCKHHIEFFLRLKTGMLYWDIQKMGVFCFLTVPMRQFFVVLCCLFFGVGVSVTFHFMCVHIIFSSISVAESPPFGK